MERGTSPWSLLRLTLFVVQTVDKHVTSIQHLSGHKALSRLTTGSFTTVDRINIPKLVERQQTRRHARPAGKDDEREAIA
jgi:hypothetical protein